MSKSNIKPTDSEIEILRILWKNGSSSVRFVNEIQNESRKVGYTTTLKIMQIMAEKGLLERDESSRTHIYSPAVREEETKNILLDKLMNTAFGGSAKNLVMQALGNYEASREELEEIRNLIDRMEEEQK